MTSSQFIPHTLLDTLICTLADHGVRFAASSPGSRCAPLLTATLREDRIETVSHIDERSAGFFALGSAKFTEFPVLLLCTSGTAGANYLPAVVEAFEARVPLLVFTADRPAELRQVGAGQTIDQIKLYGSAVKAFYELELGSEQQTQKWIQMFARKIFCAAMEGRPGPVHINIPLRSPLLPSETEELQIREHRTPRPKILGKFPRGHTIAQETEELLIKLLHPEKRGILVAGAQKHSFADASKKIAALLNWPLFADPLSGARSSTHATSHYDMLLSEEVLVPEIVLRIGDLPATKRLRQWLAALPETTIQLSLDPELAWQDPTGVVQHWFQITPQDLLDTLQPSFSKRQTKTQWLRHWQDLDKKAHKKIVDQLSKTEQLSKEHAVYQLGQFLPAETNLVVASSQAIRLVEQLFPAGKPLPRILANRGANGIDGTIATAFGVAATSQEPTFLLIGDIAFLHDIGSLATAVRTELSIKIIVLNDDGGGIFLSTETAPKSYLSETYHEHTLTPHGLNFAASAQQFGCDYHPVHTANELTTALKKTAKSTETVIIEAHVPQVN